MFTFVITLTDLDENPQRAIQSLLSHKKYVNDVKIVYPRYINNEQELYPGWFEDREKIRYEIIPIMDLKYFTDDHTIVEIPPYVDMRLGDFENLAAQSQQCSQRQLQFGLGTTLVSNRFSLLHGFLVIMAVMEWFINRFWYRGKLINRGDIWGRFIVKKGQHHRYIGCDYSYLWNIRNTEVKPKEYANASIELTPTVVHWLLRTNKLFDFGLWILVYIPIYIFISLSFSGLILYTWSPWFVTGAATGIWSLEIFISFLIARHYVKVPWLLMFCFTFPVYWISFPYVLLYYKFLIK